MIIELLIDTFLISHSTWSWVSVVFVLTYCDIMCTMCVHQANEQEREREENETSCLWQVSNCTCMRMTEILSSHFFSPRLLVNTSLYWSFVVFCRLHHRFNFSFEILTTVRWFNSFTSMSVASECRDSMKLIEWEGCVLHTFPK